MENELNILDQVQKVSAPPFLLTRIQQRIRNKKESQFSPTFIVGVKSEFSHYCCCEWCCFNEYDYSVKKRENTITEHEFITQ
jgi:2-iminoacetate synthase ThiH